MTKKNISFKYVDGRDFLPSYDDDAEEESSNSNKKKGIRDPYSFDSERSKRKNKQLSRKQNRRNKQNSRQSISDDWQ